MVHPIYTSAGSNPHEVMKATVHATMLSGRYRTEQLCRFWSRDNKSGLCSFRECSEQNLKGDINHILTTCQALQYERERMLANIQFISVSHPHLGPVIDSYGGITSQCFCQFILDCSCLPLVVNCRQKYGAEILDILFKATRNFCFAMHKTRTRLLE